MVTKKILVAALATAVALPASQAAADFKDGLVGGLVGGAVSGIIVNESAKARERKRSTVTRTYRAPVNTVERQQIRETQTALNYFGFPAGTPDGVRGRNTRNAASQFQAHMGYPATGYLAPPGDPESFLDYVARLVTNVERRTRFGEAAIDRAEHYDWTAVLARLRSYYEDVFALPVAA